MTDNLYPDWAGQHFAIPAWFTRYGLCKFSRMKAELFQSAKKLQQLDADGLSNLAPIIVLYGANPSDIRAKIGGEKWKILHKSTQRANVDRLVLCRIAGWTIEEALTFPVKSSRRAKYFVNYPKSALLAACRLGGERGDLVEQLIISQDIVRMGGTVDPSWGRKRTKREHDALVMQSAISKSNPEPWAKAWFFDLAGYSFALLKSETELAIEGAVQRHCVRSYAAACRSGKEFVLQITGEERATCSWRRGEAHLQVKGFANLAVTPQCVAAARAARKAYEKALARHVLGMEPVDA